MILNVRMARAVRLHCRIAAIVFAFALSCLFSSTAFSQGFTSGADQLVKRYCTNDCVQKNEKLTVDSAGNGMAAWQESGNKIVVARYYAASGTWSASKPLFDQTGENLQMGVDGSGNVLLVWTRYIGEWQVAVYYSRYIAAQGTWTRPATAFVHPEFEMTIRDLVVGKNGDAFLYYREWYRPYENLMRFDAVTGVWTTSDNSFAIDSAKFAVDAAGNAIAVYATARNYYSYEGSSVWVKRYNASTRQWSAETLLDSHDAQWDESGNNIAGELMLNSLALSVDPGGNAMVFWERALVKDGTTTRAIRSARYLKTGSAWIGKTIAKISSGKTNGAVLAADRYGNVNAVWNQFVGSYAKTVAARYNVGTATWTMPRVIQQGNFHSRDPNVVTDSSGNAIATWSQRADGGTQSSTSAVYRTTAARFGFGSASWGVPATIQDVNRIGYRPYLGVDVKGRGLVMWTQQSGRVANGVAVKEIRSDRLLPQ